MSRITLQDIASRVGVDRSTVSRVLSNKAAEGGISLELANKIILKARELNYIPNTSARAIRMGRFNCAALLMSTDAGRSYLPSRLLDGIHDQLAAADMHLTVAKVPDAKLNSETYVPKILRSLMADGLLINYTMHLPEHLVEMVEQRQLPAIWINTPRDHDVVYPHNRAAARQATERLLALGHRRIAYIDVCHDWSGVRSAHFSASERLTGYSEAMRSAGLKPQEVRPDRPCLNFEQEKLFTVEFLRRPDRPTALICYFSIFLPALMQAAAEAGIRIPRDLSVVTFSPENYREHGVITSAMIEPHYRMGQESVRMLHAKIKKPLDSIEPKKLDFSWRDMETCAAPPSAV